MYKHVNLAPCDTCPPSVAPQSRNPNVRLPFRSTKDSRKHPLPILLCRLRSSPRRCPSAVYSHISISVNTHSLHPDLPSRRNFYSITGRDPTSAYIITHPHPDLTSSCDLPPLGPTTSAFAVFLGSTPSISATSLSHSPQLPNDSPSSALIENDLTEICMTVGVAGPSTAGRLFAISYISY
jgi:hypothetical protein